MSTEAWRRTGADWAPLRGSRDIAPQARFAWQAWHFQDLHRCRRKLGDELGADWTPLRLTWQA